MAIPKARSFDSSLALINEGYLFVLNRCAELGSDIFETRLMFEKVYCFYGEEAAAAFYDPALFTRKGAIPKPGLMLLQDFGSTQQLDDSAHDHRKNLFLSVMNRKSVGHLVDAVTEEWLRFVKRWELRSRVVLHTEVEEILCRAVCSWAGIPLYEGESKQRAREFAAMIDGAGSFGARNVRGQIRRAKTERWARDLIENVRDGSIAVAEGCALESIANFKDFDGRLLDSKIAAVELINLLRPTVAIGRYVTFAAHALQEYPECRAKILNEPGYNEHFVQEVRRFYPFFSFVGGRARKDLTWKGHLIPEGQWVMLDLFATNHDSRIWERPQDFIPERFKNWNGNPNTFIPQGGGELFSGHRCAGEQTTIAILKRIVLLLCRSMTYEVPKQDLSISLRRMPAIPRSRFIMSKVRWKEISPEHIENVENTAKLDYRYNAQM